MTNPLLQQAANAAEDQTVDNGPTYERRIIPAGYTIGRFIGYVEIGKRPQRPYQGKDKPDAQEVRLSFELLGPNNIREIEVGEEKLTVSDAIHVKITKKQGDRAGFVKLLKKMAYGRDSITNFAQMLGEPFLLRIIHNTAKDKAGKEQTWANIKDDDGNWTVGAPVKTDPLTNESVTLEVPAPTMDYKLLLWDSPTVEQWASLFIDGSYTRKEEDGTETTHSKNWLQEDIVNSALDFKGSKLEELLLNQKSPGLEEMTLPGDTGDQEPTKPASPANPPAEEKAATAPEKPAGTAPAAETSGSEKPAATGTDMDEAAAKAQAMFDDLGV